MPNEFVIEMNKKIKSTTFQRNIFIKAHGRWKKH